MNCVVRIKCRNNYKCRKTETKGSIKTSDLNELGSEEPDWCCNYSGKIEYIKPIKYFIRSQIPVASQKN
jgi:hypothetical protein